MTLDDFADALPLPTEAEPDAIKASFQVPSASKPGVFYTVTAFADGSYSCDCPGRQYQMKCRHIKGAVMMLEGQEVFKDMEPKPQPKTFAPLQAFIDRHQHINSMIAWHDEEFQELLPVKEHDALEAILQNPGATRNDLCSILRWPINCVTGRVAALKALGLVFEEGIKEGPTGKPRSRLWRSDFIVTEKDWKRR